MAFVNDHRIRIPPLYDVLLRPLVGGVRPSCTESFLTTCQKKCGLRMVAISDNTRIFVVEVLNRVRQRVVQSDLLLPDIKGNRRREDDDLAYFTLHRKNAHPVQSNLRLPKSRLEEDRQIPSSDGLQRSSRLVLERLSSWVVSHGMPAPALRAMS